MSTGLDEGYALTEKAKNERRIARLTLIAAILGVLTALVTLGGTVLGLLYHQATQRTGAQQDTINGLNQQVKDLHASLRAQPPVASPSTPLSTAGKVLRRGQFTLADVHCVDLDTQAADWGVVEGNGSRCDIGLFNNQGNIYDEEAGSGIAVVGAGSSPTFETCASAVQKERQPTTKDKGPGTRLCVATSEHNFALLQIVNVAGWPDDYRSVTFDATVWSGS